MTVTSLGLGLIPVFMIRLLPSHVLAIDIIITIPT